MKPISAKTILAIVAAVAVFLVVYGLTSESKCYTYNGGLIEKPCN